MVRATQLIDKSEMPCWWSQVAAKLSNSANGNLVLHKKMQYCFQVELSFDQRYLCCSLEICIFTICYFFDRSGNSNISHPHLAFSVHSSGTLICFHFIYCRPNPNILPAAYWCIFWRATCSIIWEKEKNKIKWYDHFYFHFVPQWIQIFFFSF